MEQKCSKIKDVAVSGIYHLDTTHSYMIGFVKANPHSRSAWKFILENLEWVKVFFRVVFLEATFGTECNISHVV
jgi:hypothetical protein